ncbi:hypothetical protein [Natronorubrum texcoconense]|uniref:Uncharacterized protein n=1 Tax=Natronorubrum texcoconense TaxID=1095776 RepID=A0A1G8U6P9_9EURY|nr:hypothetical protein [Natronorubrum texcoconense]SDJ48720.1 hypothetical protein SAMN04515672_0736 [Natronorubrum texcoconense]
MSSENLNMLDKSRAFDRREVLRSIGTTAVIGTSVLGLSGTVKASSDCPDLNNGEYTDCDSTSEEIDYYYRPHERRIEGETSLSVGYRGWTSSNCNDCVTYSFDLAGLHEAHGTGGSRGDADYVKTFGFRWSVDDSVVPDPQPDSSSNIDSGKTNPDGSASPSGDNEDAFSALGDVLVAGGSVLYPKLGVPAFLYTVARASSHNVLQDESTGEVVFNDGWSTSDDDSVGFGYHNMRFQVPDNAVGSVTFEAFTDTGNREVTAETKTFDLDDHGYTCPSRPCPTVETD